MHQNIAREKSNVMQTPFRRIKLKLKKKSKLKIQIRGLTFRRASYQRKPTLYNSKFPQTLTQNALGWSGYDHGFPRPVHGRQGQGIVRSLRQGYPLDEEGANLLEPKGGTPEAESPSGSRGERQCWMERKPRVIEATRLADRLRRRRNGTAGCSRCRGTARRTQSGEPTEIRRGSRRFGERRIRGGCAKGATLSFYSLYISFSKI